MREMRRGRVKNSPLVIRQVTIRARVYTESLALESVPHWTGDVYLLS